MSVKFLLTVVMIFSLTTESLSTTDALSTTDEENAELREIISLLSKNVTPTAPAAELVSIDFVDADLRSVIALLAKKYDVNIYGGEKITGKITAHLKNVPLENLLKILLESNGFSMVKRGDAYYEILTVEDALEEKQKQIFMEMEFKSFDIKYADLTAVSNLFSTMGILDAKCKVALYPETSQIIIRATESQLQNIERLLAKIDVQPPQILIKARLLEINKKALDNLGIEWAADFLAGDLKISNVKGTLGAPDVGGEKTFAFNLTHPRFDIDALIETLVYRKVASVLTAPRLTTSNNTEATMIIADRVPVITRESTTSPEGTVTTTESVEFVDSGLTLTITPRKVGVNQILLTIAPVITQISDYTETDPPQPIIDTRQTKTTVIIRDDQWLVIGGLITKNTTKMRKKIPLLGDIPLLGIAFSSRGDIDTKGDLLILVNAKILDDESIGVDTKSSLEKQDALETGKKPEKYKSLR